MSDSKENTQHRSKSGSKGSHGRKQSRRTNVKSKSASGQRNSQTNARAQSTREIRGRHGQPVIYVAVDTPEFAKAKALVTSLQGTDVGFKIGLEFFMAHGHQGVVNLLGDKPLFLDLKFHDIPNTVAGAVKSVAGLKPTILNVHAAGGFAMMKAAKDALHEAQKDTSADQRTKLIGVTVLTSMDSNDLTAVGQDKDLSQQVLRLAKLTHQAGLDGVVCSAQEAGQVREDIGEVFMTVTPGMRVSLSASDDQKRSMSPGAALENGSTHLVVGRLVTNAPDPAAAVRAILAGVSQDGSAG